MFIEGGRGVESGLSCHGCDVVPIGNNNTIVVGGIVMLKRHVGVLGLWLWMGGERGFSV